MVKEDTFVRKTICLDDKLKDKVMNMEANLIKETKHHWSDSKVINMLIQYAFESGATSHTIAKIYDEGKKKQ